MLWISKHNSFIVSHVLFPDSLSKSEFPDPPRRRGEYQRLTINWSSAAGGELGYAGEQIEASRNGASWAPLPCGWGAETIFLPNFVCFVRCNLHTLKKKYTKVFNSVNEHRDSIDETIRASVWAAFRASPHTVSHFHFWPFFLLPEITAVLTPGLCGLSSCFKEV